MFDRVDHTNKSFLRCVLTCNLSCFSVGLAHGFGKWNWSAKQNEYNYGWNYIIMMMGLNQVQKKLIKFSLVSLLGYFCIESLTHINRISPAKDVFSYMWEHSKCFFRYNYMNYSHELLTFVCSVLESMRNMVSHSFERLFGLFFSCVTSDPNGCTQRKVSKWNGLKNRSETILTIIFFYFVECTG